MDGILDAFADDPGLIVGLILGPLGMLFVGVIVTVITRATVKNAREREQTRRELAAYIAEGSMTPEDAERILVPRPWFASTVLSSGKTIKAAVRSATE